MASDNITIFGIYVDPWVFYTAIIVTIGTLVSIVTLAWDICKSKRRVSVKVSNAVCESNGLRFRTYKIKVINKLSNTTRIAEILGRDIDGKESKFGNYVEPNVPQTLVKGDDISFTINNTDHIKHLIQERRAAFVSFTIVDKLGNPYTGKTHKNVEGFFIFRN